MSMFKVLLAVAALSAALSLGAPTQAATLHTSDFITTPERTAVVDFESLPAGSGVSNSMSQDGVSVQQIQGDANDIWTTCGSACWFSNTSLTWYPNGGDHGYTEISLVSGGDFQDIGLDYGGSKFGLDTLFYELLNDNVSVQFGSVAMPQTSDGYLGFSGGGFDTLRIAGVFSSDTIGSFGDGTYQALPIDNIELRDSLAPVPLPGALPLFGGGLGLLSLFGGWRRRIADAA